MRDDDPVSNPSANPHFAELIEQRLARRDFLGGGAALGALAATGGVGALLSAVPIAADAHGARPALLGFQGVPVSSADAVVIPPGYSQKVLIAWGDPVSNGPAFQPDASNSAADQALQWGMHNDGMVYFPIRGSRRGLLVQNNEYTDDGLLFADGITAWSAEKTAKALNAHGVSIIEVRRARGGRDADRDADRDDDHEHDHDNDDGADRRNLLRRQRGEWEVVRPSRYARRITGQTPIRIAGPAAGDARLRTSADPTGARALGTLNNCAMGYTPWGTYLACEENFNGYFKTVRAPLSATATTPARPDTRTNLEKRYGIAAFGNPGANYWRTHPRFDADVEPNEPNRFGWVVEIDPFNPASTPAKRTALGRLKHEGAWVQEARDGRVVVYMGDDERNEYIYRYVSADKWRRMVRRGVNPLDEGTLYVAKFSAGGSGEWIALTPDHPALATWSLADILINTRAAADAVGATMMDRPEWIDTFPEQLTAICTLTNNNRRGSSPPSSNNPNGSTVAGSARPPVDGAANPRAINDYGHIITWSYQRDWTEPTFRWDLFALAGDPANAAHGSTIVGDKYGSPDGIYVAPSGRLWIQTDVSTTTINAGAYAGFGNNQMLCADPYTRETRRFLVGPKQCEVTGVFVTPDERTMFVGIQHPGESPSELSDPANPTAFSAWPPKADGTPGPRPRSACVVITKDDGGKIGS